MCIYHAVWCCGQQKKAQALLNYCWLVGIIMLAINKSENASVKFFKRRQILNKTQLFQRFLNTIMKASLQDVKHGIWWYTTNLELFSTDLPFIP